MVEQNEKKVLIVEDDRALRSILGSGLGKAGFLVVEASNGEEGLEVAQNERPDLILLDVIMPKVDGFEVLQKMRECEWGKDMPVVVLSNLGSEDLKEKAQKLGAKGYIVKSDFDIEGIVSIVKEKLKETK